MNWFNNLCGICSPNDQKTDKQDGNETPQPSYNTVSKAYAILTTTVKNTIQNINSKCQ